VFLLGNGLRGRNGRDGLAVFHDIHVFTLLDRGEKRGEVLAGFGDAVSPPRIGRVAVSLIRAFRDFWSLILQAVPNVVSLLLQCGNCTTIFVRNDSKGKSNRLWQIRCIKACPFRSSWRDRSSAAKRRHETLSKALLHYARRGIVEEQKAEQTLRAVLRKIRAAKSDSEAGNSALPMAGIQPVMVQQPLPDVAIPSIQPRAGRQGTILKVSKGQIGKGLFRSRERPTPGVMTRNPFGEIVRAALHSALDFGGQQ